MAEKHKAMHQMQGETGVHIFAIKCPKTHRFAHKFSNFSQCDTPKLPCGTVDPFPSNRVRGASAPKSQTLPPNVQMN